MQVSHPSIVSCYLAQADVRCQHKCVCVIIRATPKQWRDFSFPLETNFRQYDLPTTAQLQGVLHSLNIYNDPICRDRSIIVVCDVKNEPIRRWKHSRYPVLEIEPTEESSIFSVYFFYWAFVIFLYTASAFSCHVIILLVVTWHMSWKHQLRYVLYEMYLNIL